MKKYFILLLFASNLYAKDIINNINVTGNDMIDTSIILGYINSKKGTTYSSETINKDIKILYETNFFENVTITYKNKTLNINVVEYPLITEVIFEGNDKITTSVLEMEISTKEKTILNRDKILKDVERIISLYKRSGVFDAKIDVQTIKDGENILKLIFKIEEGEAAKVSKIDFVGNKEFSTSSLQDEIRSKEYKWWKFGVGSDYSPELLEVDREMLRMFYYRNGYPDFEILSVSSDLDLKTKEVFITYLLNEGKMHMFGDITVTNNLEKVSTSKLENIAKEIINEGTTFNNELIQKSMDELNKELAKEGYVFVDIIPQVRKSIDDYNRDTINIDFVVNESMRAYVGEIRIIGNTRTHDNIIREELRFEEGDPLNLVNISLSIQDLYNTGYFEKVDIEREGGNMPDTMNLIIAVKERKTGQLSFGVGYSTDGGFNANVGIVENNLLGMGQSLGLNVIFTKKNSKNINLSYGKPNFLDRDLFFGVNGFYREENDRTLYDFLRTKYGGGISASYSVTDDLRQRIFYDFSRDDVRVVNNSDGYIIKEGVTYLSSIGQTLSIDRRDNRLNTTNGFYTYWTVEYAGLGGDKFYLKNTATLFFYYPLWRDILTFKIGGDVGAIRGMNGTSITSDDAFYLNSNILRGFIAGGMGPRYKGKDGNMVGGKNYYVGVAEIKFPIASKGLGLYAGIFANAGTLFGLDESNGYTKSQYYDSKSIRSAGGVTLYWNTPMGLLNFTFSGTIKKEKYDEDEFFNFNFGMNF